MVKSQQKIDRSRAAMEKMVSEDTVRRPNTQKLMRDALLDPSSVPPQGRERLALFVKETYGVSADALLPYLEGVETEEEDAPTV